MPAITQYNIHKSLSQWLKIALLVACVVALGFTLPQKPWIQLQQQVGLLVLHWPIVLVVIALCPVNWALEALKWQLLSRNYQPMGFAEAYKGVLTGLGIGALVPQWLGDFVGRTWHQTHEDKKQQLKALPALWLGNFAAFQITHFFGLVGLGYLVWEWRVEVEQSNTYIWATALLLVLTLSIYYRVQWYAQPLLGLKFLGKWRASLERSLAFSDRLRTQALLIAMARYLTFFSQWWLLLNLANPSTALALAAAIALIFSLKSSVPTLNLLGDLGIREYAAVFVLKWLGWESAQVIPLTLCIWIINLLFPTLVGFVFMLPIFKPKPSVQ